MSAIQEEEKMAKNIVVLSDGTGQDGGTGHDTNVYKLFRMLEDRTPDQIVFYDQGLGTDANRIGGMAFGAGIDKNILQCYRFIFDHYESGDKIFLFGFSRGAATVRSLASFIHYFGILPASRPELIKRAYNIYKNRKRSYDQSLSENPEEQVESSNVVDKIVSNVSDALRDDLDKPGGRSDEFVRQHPNQWVQIEFLGVWDTVPALGLVAAPGLDSLLDHIPSWRHQYHNFKLRGSVKHACHALSIDDNRKWFFPSVWKEYDPDKTKRANVEQVWFGGSHTDVGGGFFEAGFSDIALEWMVQKAFEHGIRLYFESRPSWNFCIAPDPTDEFHNPRSAWGKVYASGVRDRIWDIKAFDTFGPPRVHRSVLDRVVALRNTKEPYNPCILDPKVYPYGSQIDGWLIKEYCREAYREWSKDIRKRLPEARLPVFSIWMPQLFLKKRMSDSVNPAIQEISRLLLPDGMPTPETYPATESNPLLTDKDFTKWMRRLDNVTLWQWEASNKHTALREWFSGPENQFLQAWVDRNAGQWLLWSWMLEHGSELRNAWMPCPEQYVSFLLQTMTLPEKSSLVSWFAENTSFQKWIENNKYELTEFEGRKVLVEEVRPVVRNPDGDALVLRHMKEEDVMTLQPAAQTEEMQKKKRVLVLRDYDAEELKTILADPSTLALLKYRMQRDQKALKKLLQAQQKKKGIPSASINEEALKYRILRDASRWTPKEEEKDPSHEHSPK
jgi:uncharacterized protein (DUF2235 family)